MRRSTGNSLLRVWAVEEERFEDNLLQEIRIAAKLAPMNNPARSNARNRGAPFRGVTLRENIPSRVSRATH
jgi:hypothetical protein